MIQAIWLYSNPQVFQDKIVKKDDEHLFPLTDHHLLGTVKVLTPAAPFLLLVFISVPLKLFTKYIVKRKCLADKDKFDSAPI